MNINSVYLEGFTRHDCTHVKPPTTGIVLIVGSNGSGKSSILEGVSWALWGETLRGEHPWRDGEKCAASVAFDGVHVVNRVRLNGKSIVSFDGALNNTATKTQAALDRVIGSFDVWRRSCVFSSHDAASFMSAPDGERKRLLEEMLGLGRFDAALAACRADLRKAEGAVSQAQQAVAVIEERRRGAAQRVEEAERTLVEIPAPEGEQVTVLRARLRLLKASILDCDQEATELREQIQQAHSGVGEAKASVSAAKRALAQWENTSHCPTCLQAISPEFVASLRATAEEETRAAQQTFEKARQSAAGAVSSLAELEESRRGFSEQFDAAKEKWRVLEQAGKDRDAAETVLMRSKDVLQGVEKEHAGLTEQVRAAEHDVEALLACERVLGLRGVRASILGKALSGLEDAANAWLARLAPGVSMHLASTTERKSGGMSDAIGVTVLGFGGGLGYKAASGGERRRLDLAVTLALADVAAAAHGGRRGTLFADEAFDALDEAGIAAAARIVEELARDRCVVVISHSDDLKASLPTAHVWRVEEGRVTVAT